jgi:hypothetical protein
MLCVSLGIAAIPFPVKDAAVMRPFETFPHAFLRVPEVMLISSEKHCPPGRCPPNFCRCSYGHLTIVVSTPPKNTALLRKMALESCALPLPWLSRSRPRVCSAKRVWSSAKGFLVPLSPGNAGDTSQKTTETFLP